MVETLQDVDTSPVRVMIGQATRGSWRLLFAAARRLRRFLKRGGDTNSLVQEEERVLEQPVQRLTLLLEQQWPYFRKLEARLQLFAKRRGVL